MHSPPVAQSKYFFFLLQRTRKKSFCCFYSYSTVFMNRIFFLLFIFLFFSVHSRSTDSDEDQTQTECRIFSLTLLESLEKNLKNYKILFLNTFLSMLQAAACNCDLWHLQGVTRKKDEYISLLSNEF